MRRLALAILVPLLLAAGLAGWGLLNARADPVVRAATIGLPDWPAGAAPVRVVLASDIHLGNLAMDPARLRRIVARIDALKPDLVLLAGDFVVGHDPSGLEPRAAALTGPLAGLEPRLGTVAVLGNHDYWTDPQQIRAALEPAGITVLDNAAERRGPIVLAGIGDAFSGHDDAPAALAAARQLSGPIVAVNHSPDLAPRLPADVHLLLAGHTHCGQVVLPLIGPLAAHAPRAGWRRLYDPRYRCGVIHDPGRTVIVTAGLGSGTALVRFGAPPDIWLVTLGPVVRP